MPLESGIRHKKVWMQIHHWQTTDQVFQAKSLFYSEYFLIFRALKEEAQSQHRGQSRNNHKVLCAVPLIEVITPWERSTVTPPEQNAEHTHSVKQAQKPPFRSVWVSSFQRYLQGSTTCLDESPQMPIRWKSQLSISPRNFCVHPWTQTLGHSWRHIKTRIQKPLLWSNAVHNCYGNSAGVWLIDPQKCSLARFF